MGSGTQDQDVSDLMSEMGQSRRFGHEDAASEYPPETGIVTTSRHVSKVPRTDLPHQRSGSTKLRRCVDAAIPRYRQPPPTPLTVSAQCFQGAADGAGEGRCRSNPADHRVGCARSLACGHRRSGRSPRIGAKVCATKAPWYSGERVLSATATAGGRAFLAIALEFGRSRLA